MWIRNQHGESIFVAGLYFADGDDDGSGGGGGSADDKGDNADGKNADPPKIDLENPAVKKLVDAAVSNATKNVTALETKYQKLAEQASAWEGIDLEKAKELISAAEQSDDDKISASKETQELVERALGRARKAFQGDMDKLKATITEKDQVNEGLQTELHKLVIVGGLQSAANALKIPAEYQEDAILLGQQVWKIKDNKATPIDPATKEVMTHPKTAEEMSMDDWMEEEASKRPAWRGVSSGDGALGSGDTPLQGQDLAARAKNMDMAEWRKEREAGNIK